MIPSADRQMSPAAVSADPVAAADPAGRVVSEVAREEVARAAFKADPAAVGQAAVGQAAVGQAGSARAAWVRMALGGWVDLHPAAEQPS
jgi:hypothetical protein